MGATQDQPSLLKMIADLERRIRALEHEKRASATAVTSGTWQVLDSDDGQPLVQLGDLTEFPARPDGNPQQGAALYRDTGEIAFSVAADDTTDGLVQFAAMRDRAGNMIMRDDAETGYGISRPWIPLSAFAILDVTKWSRTTSAGFVAAYWVGVYAQHARIQVAILMQADVGCTGEAQLVLNDTPVGNVLSFSNNNIVMNTFNLINIPASNINRDAADVLAINFRRSAGSGTIGIMPYFAYGRPLNAV